MILPDWGPSLRFPLEENPKTLTDATLRRLRRDIISGLLKPGQKLRVQELTTAYDVGTSPLREALFQLASDGFVRSSGQRGFTVAGLSNMELLDITHWRCTLECEALRRSLVNRSVDWEAELISAHHRLKGVEQDPGHSDDEIADHWERQHWLYHLTLYSRCGSAWLLRFCELLGEHGERYRRSFVTYRNIPSKIGAEHQAILDAILAKKGDEAIAILAQHIERAAEMATAHLFEYAGTRNEHIGAADE